MTYYAYLHARPNTEDAHGIFYVGKGQGGRAFKVNRKNPHHKNLVHKYGANNLLIGIIPCSSESTAFELEIGLIKCLKHSGVKLSNKTSGGDGVPGYIRTEEWKANHSKLMKGKPSPTKGRKLSQEQRNKISESLRRTGYWLGKTHTPESKRKMGVNKGLIWVNNGVNRERVKPEEVPLWISKGYVQGIKFNR